MTPECSVEIKVCVADLTRTERPVSALSGGPAQRLEQEDVFWACPRGRLKLRRDAGAAQAELIFNKRPDTRGPKSPAALCIARRIPPG